MMNQPELDAKKIGEFLTQMKKQMGQVEGECQMMRTDAVSSLFQSVANMFNQVFAKKDQAENKVKELEATLDKIYQGHPDIKISMEKKKDDSKPKKP
jgi:hypothetical protein